MISLYYAYFNNRDQVVAIERVTSDGKRKIIKGEITKPCCRQLIADSPSSFLLTEALDSCRATPSRACKARSTRYSESEKALMRERKEVMQSNGLSQVEIANRLNVSRYTIQRL